MNEKMFLLLNGLSGQGMWPDRLIYFSAEILPWLVVIGLAIYPLFAKDKIRAVGFILLAFFSAIVAWFLVSLFKYNFYNPRPFEVLNIVPVFLTERGAAFPSGHATFFGALAAVIFLRSKKLGALFIIFTLLISLARIVAGVHWPVDVVVGLILGGIIGWAIGFVSERFVFKLKK